MGRAVENGHAVVAGAGRRWRRFVPVLLAAVLQAAGTPPASAQAPDPVREFASAGALRLGGTTNVKLSATAPVSRAIPLAQMKGGAQCRVMLELGEITFSSPPPVAYDVYVNLPAGAAPKRGDAHHVGSLTFYGLDGKRSPPGAHATGQLLDITSQARAKDSGGGKLVVTFVPFSLVVPASGSSAAKPVSDVEIGRIEIREVKAP
jgi:hypothetical protein